MSRQGTARACGKNSGAGVDRRRPVGDWPHRPPSTGHRLPVTALRSPATAHQPPSTGNRPPLTGHRQPSTGYRLPLTGNRPPVTVHRSPSPASSASPRAPLPPSGPIRPHAEPRSTRSADSPIPFKFPVAPGAGGPPARGTLLQHVPAGPAATSTPPSGFSPRRTSRPLTLTPPRSPRSILGRCEPGYRLRRSETRERLDLPRRLRRSDGREAIVAQRKP